MDDSTGRLFTATLMNLLRRHFDLVLESCRLGVCKPDPEIYAYALAALQAKPQEVQPKNRARGGGGPSKHPNSLAKASGCPSPGCRAWLSLLYLQAILLDDIGENLKPAQEMGMATVLVRDTESVLKELEELSGVQARSGGLGPFCPLLSWGILDQICRAGRDGLGLLGLAVLVQDLWVALETSGMGFVVSYKPCPPPIASSPGPAEPCPSQTHDCPTSSGVVEMSRGAPGLLRSSPSAPHPVASHPRRAPADGLQSSQRDPRIRAHPGRVEGAASVMSWPWAWQGLGGGAGVVGRV